MHFVVLFLDAFAVEEKVTLRCIWTLYGQF